MRRAETATIAGITLFVCGLTAIGVAQGYPRQAILFPLVASALILLFAALRLRELWWVSRAEAVADEGETDSAEGRVSGMRGDVRAFAWVFAVLPAIWLAGYVVGLTLYVLAFLLAHGIGTLRAGAIALGAGAFVQVVFGMVLKVLLPVGVLGALAGF